MADDRNVKSRMVFFIPNMYSQEATVKKKDIFDLTYTLTPALL